MRSLMWRQAAALAAAVGLGAAVVTTALLDQLAAAVALLGVVGVFGLGWLVQLRRRVTETQRQLSTLARTQEQQAAQGLLAAVSAGSREAAERHQALLAAIGESAAEVSRRLGRVEHAQRGQIREVEALLQLHRELAPRAPMPPSGSWALNPTDLLELCFLVDRVRPGLVLELGSGTSSVWLGYALGRHGGRLVSLDHDPRYAALTRAQLARHGLTEVVEVRQAPLCPTTVAGETFEWYDQAALAGVSEVDLLLVDGPPGQTGPRARLPAVPVLADRLAARAVVVLDDADREDEQEILQQWTDSVAGLAREPGTPGKLAVLRYSRPLAPASAGRTISSGRPG